MRKCLISKSRDYEFQGYFIRWTETSYIQRHPENPEHDRIYVKQLAIIERCDTFEIELCEPEEIEFLDPPTIL